MTRTVPAARIGFNDDDRAEILAMIDHALRTGSLTLGPLTEAFEQAFAARHGVDHAIAVSSGTSALEIILRILGVEGRDVVIPTNTFYATAGAAVHAGARPRFADISPSTMALSVESLEEALTPSTAAVILVHIGGVVSPEIDAIAQLCAARGIALVEDAAHAHGCSYRGVPAGRTGVAGAFSFYPTKVLTSGEGGMIVTDDPNIAEEARIYRDQGKAGFLGGDHVRLGYAWRMSELHAAVGQVHLRRLDEAIAVRRRVAARFDEGLRAVDGCAALPVPDGCVTNYYKYLAVLDPGIDRADLKQRLRTDAGVSLTGEVYALPLHRQPIFAGVHDAPLPVADDLCARHICLPVHSDMTDEEADYVIDGIAAALKPTQVRA